ncbi:ion transporter [Pseudoalteromonas agarivorans]|uniref:ion transporter n=1 Tax=Pseudoalteromonas agarivorans TaxID=176102 RepID=UPI0003D61BAA|nr:ion transporter [Pseudoalteromonas agarivorans]ETJ48605.1 cation transporter [Pseudoalteromonas agarivorans]
MMSQLQKLFQRIDKSKIFQSFVIAVIVVSALTVGAHTYSLHPTVEFILNWMDVGITAFFLIELIIRFIASKGIKDFFSKGWNIFDTIIVLGSLYPAAGSTMLLARLLRIFRVLRLVSMIPELRLLVNSLLKAIPQMGYIALLMFVIFYIYAAMGSMMFADINPVLWQDVSISMLTLFRIATFEDWTDYIPLSFFILFVDNRFICSTFLHTSMSLCQQKYWFHKLISDREVDSESRNSKRDKIRRGRNQPVYSY